MKTSLTQPDPRILSMCQVVDVRDPRDMDTASRVSELIPPDPGVFGYQLLGRELLRSRFRDPIATFTFRLFGDLGVFYMDDRFSTRFLIDRTGIDRFCITSMFHGRATLYQDGRETTAAGTSGLIYRGSPGTRVVTSDDNARQNLWIEVPVLERALEGMLGERLRSRLQFRPGFDWTSGLAAACGGSDRLRRRGNLVCLISCLTLGTQFTVGGGNPSLSVLIIPYLSSFTSTNSHRLTLSPTATCRPAALPVRRRLGRTARPARRSRRPSSPAGKWSRASPAIARIV